MEQQMNSNTAQQSVAPLMCRANCGFYGNQQCENYCSKCFKEQLRRQQDSSTPAVMHTAASPSSSSSSIAVQQPSPTVTTVADSPVAMHATVTSAPMPCAPPLTQVQSSMDPAPSAYATHSANLQQCSTEALAIGGGPGAADNGLLATSPISASPSSSSLTSAVDGTTLMQSKTSAKNRCHMCKRKIGLTGFDCRCGGKYCSEHRYSDAHSCSFDYKTHGQQQLRKANPGCVTNKIDKL